MRTLKSNKNIIIGKWFIKKRLHFNEEWSKNNYKLIILIIKKLKINFFLF